MSLFFVISFDKNMRFFEAATNKKRLLGRNVCVDNNIMCVTSKDANVLDNCYLLEYLSAKVDLSTIASNANPPSISAATSLPPHPPAPACRAACAGGQGKRA